MVTVLNPVAVPDHSLYERDILGMIMMMMMDDLGYLDFDVELDPKGPKKHRLKTICSLHILLGREKGLVHLTGALSCLFTRVDFL